MPPLRATLTLVKGYGSYTIPKVDVVFSGDISDKAGPDPDGRLHGEQCRSRTEPRPQPGGGAASTVDIQLVSPGAYLQQDNAGFGSLHGERIHQVDMRVSKLLHFGGTKARANMDIYNALNSSAVLTENDDL